MRVEQRWVLARAVARGDRARLLDADNRSSRSILLSEAVASGQAYFVTPRPELLVVDVDLPDDPRQAADVVSSFDLLMDLADRHGVPHVRVASGRPGHHHGYLVAGTSSARAALAGWCRERGLDVRERGVRPPGSPHRDGKGEAELLGSISPKDAAELLEAPVCAEAVAAMARALVPVVLPARVRAALRHGAQAAGYASPSHGRMALAVAVRSRGGPRALMEALLNDPCAQLGATFRARPATWRAGEVRRLWDKAGAWLESRPHEAPGRVRAGQLRAAAAGYPWRGAAGGTDLAVVEALCAIADKAGTTRVAASLGDVSIGAGVSVDTARSSLRRLVVAGWLRVVADATARTARVYELRVPDSVSSAPEADMEAQRVPLLDLGADIARWGALGKVTTRVARAVEMAGAGVGVRELAETLSMSAASVRHHLRKLARTGLARRVGQEWTVQLEPVAVARLEDLFGVAGRREAARAALVRMRAARAEIVATYRARWALARPRAPRAPGVLAHT